GAAFFRGRTSGVTSQVAFRTFASAVDLTAGDLWIGVLGQYTGVPGSPATYRYFDIGLYSAGTGAGNQVFDIDNGSTGATGFWNIQSVTNVVASTVSGSTKSFLVARVTSGSVYFWINPSPATMASGILTTGDASYVGSVTLVGVTTTADRIRINAGGLTSGSIGQGFADEVRVGTTFSDVAPVTVHTPHITGLVLAGTMLTMTATNGANNGQFVLLESTNVAVPLAQWTPVLTNTFDGGGNLNLSTNILNMGNTKAFYILSQ
ncbi:MAG TPA: hypothetical protein VN625_07135, partial [Desulfuromonadaceae bacterium]|nr:hypothetical protein [Desulfuromonadaceae bacterium]